jgi:hypothetical protein
MLTYPIVKSLRTALPLALIRARVTPVSGSVPKTFRLQIFDPLLAMF